MTRLVPIGVAAQELGVHPDTLGLYGSRSHKNRKVMEQLRQVASEVSS